MTEHPTDHHEGRPLPTPTALTAGFWEAARERRLVVQRCDACGVHRHYPQPRCADCLSEEWSWHEIAGSGVVYTFTVTYQAFHPAWSERLPYAVATVELDGGIRMVTDLPPGDEERVTIGAPVEVFFEDATAADGTPCTLPRFRLSPT